jgi:hypothetical protein
MIWKRRKRKNPSPDQLEALRAKVHAELQLKQAEAQHADALSLADKLRQVREKNHFGPSLEWTFGGGKP